RTEFTMSAADARVDRDALAYLQICHAGSKLANDSGRIAADDFRQRDFDAGQAAPQKDVEVIDRCRSDFDEDFTGTRCRIGKISSSEIEAALARLTLQANLERAVSNADLIIEAAPEQIELKLDLFARLDRVCGPQAVFASNTSALSITEMAGATKRPQRFI